MERVAAFVIVGTSLVILADFETTGPIAVAFGYLILLSSLVLVGPIAAERLQTVIGVKPTGGTSGGGTY